ncbi:uncharacterized protein LOC141858324 [Brevipalpus obovatus]|uniref:uncharacterized protein LOC141858324 n=1 Tax=Brevipalpus obovatus TaxID=246614 RepID=UPI003D9EAFEC
MLSYNGCVEFGLKLGYTESQVQMALVKVGPSAGQNELLEELIKLGSTSLTSSTKSTLSSSVNSANLDTDSSSKKDDHDGCESSSSSTNRRSHCDNDPSSSSSSSSPISDNLRPIVIDGSNVAMSHGNKEVFSCRGLKICVDWFKARGHRVITVFVPMRCKESSGLEYPIKDREILNQLEAEKILVFTPSRQVGGRRIICHDDLYILNLASQNDGIVVSNDNYRDLINRNPEYKKVVEERLLMYSFVNERFMPPDDPLGRHGPSLDVFLRKKDSSPPHCPYGKKCTYGNKCKYYHPERGNQPQKTITERLIEQTQSQLMEVKARNAGLSVDSHEKVKAAQTSSLPLNTNMCDTNKSSTISSKKQPLQRAKLQVTSHSASLPLGTRKVFGASNGKAEVNWNRSNDSNNFSKDNINDSTNNFHRKLARQLTLNPSFDARLLKMSGYDDNKSAYKNRTPEKKAPMNSGHRQVMRIRSDGGLPSHSLNGNLKNNSVGGSMNDIGLVNDHSNNTNIGTIGMGKKNISTNGGYICNGGMQHTYRPYPNFNTYNHSNVTRIASAPDSNTSNWQMAFRQSLINANSDSRLSTNQTNLSLPLNPSIHEMNQAIASLYQASQSPWTNPEPHQLTSSHPTTHPSQLPNQAILSPNYQQSNLLQQQQAQLQSWSNLVSSATNGGSNSTHNFNSIWKLTNESTSPKFPPLTAKKSADNASEDQQTSSSLNARAYRSLSPTLFSDNPRSKLYFHLSQIFPEKQVKAAMTMLPGESDAKKICAAILSLLQETDPQESPQRQ